MTDSAAIKTHPGKPPLIPTITTVDTEESRKAFAKLNVHKSSGVTRKKKTQGGDDDDIVNVPDINPANQVPTNVVISDDGGRRMSGAMVYVIFWGHAWTTNPPPSPAPLDICADMMNIMRGPYLSGLVQYGVESVGTVGVATLAAAYIDTRALPPWDYLMTDVNYEAWLAMTSGPIPSANDTIVCVVMPPGSSPSDSSLGGEHDHSLQPDLNWIPTMWIGWSDRNSMSALFSHELVEALTDPDGDAIQVKPRSSTSWHEIVDVCENLDYVQLNGATVESYWSAEDQACIVPQPEVIDAWQIECFHKKWGDDNPNENIFYVGGHHRPTGVKFWMAQTEVIARIENGDAFYVVGADGSEAGVIVRTHYPPWAPQGTKYITTAPDNSKEDNLLSLPDCGSLSNW